MQGLLDVRTASAHLGVSTQTLYRLVAKGEIAVVKIGDRTLFRLHDLEEFVAHNTRRRDRADGSRSSGNDPGPTRRGRVR